MSKKSFFPQDTKTLVLFTVGGWFITWVIDKLQFQGGIITVIGGVAAFASIGGLLGLIVLGIKKVFKK